MFRHIRQRVVCFIMIAGLCLGVGLWSGYHSHIYTLCAFNMNVCPYATKSARCLFYVLFLCYLFYSRMRLLYTKTKIYYTFTILSLCAMLSNEIALFCNFVCFDINDYFHFDTPQERKLNSTEDPLPSPSVRLLLRI